MEIPDIVLNPHNRNRPHRCGLSTIESLIGATLLAVLALAVMLHFNPMNEWERRKADQKNLAKLNVIANIFKLQNGMQPDRYLTVLNTSGFTKSRLLRTPYGGYYQYEATSQSVINPQAPTMH